MLLLTVSCLAASAETTWLADILLNVDYGDEVTYVIGHKSPDADTIGSAMAYAGLLQQLGINAKAAATAKVNRETQYALDLFGLDQPEIISNAEGKQFVLVDHSEYSQAQDGMMNARVVSIVDLCPPVGWNQRYGTVGFLSCLALRELQAGSGKFGCPDLYLKGGRNPGMMRPLSRKIEGSLFAVAF